MRPRTLALIIAASLCLLVFIFELVRRKKLNEEYSWLWMITGTCLLALAVSPDLLFWITSLFGAGAPTSVFYLLGLLFLFLIVIHYSTIISKLTNDIKSLSQKIAILELKIKTHENTDS
jgi:hypothetical protein